MSITQQIENQLAELWGQGICPTLITLSPATFYGLCAEFGSLVKTRYAGVPVAVDDRCKDMQITSEPICEEFAEDVASQFHYRALAAGVRDDSYAADDGTKVSSFSGSGIVIMPGGRQWRAVGHAPTTDEDGHIGFTLINQ